MKTVIKSDTKVYYPTKMIHGHACEQVSNEDGSVSLKVSSECDMYYQFVDNSKPIEVK